MIHSTVVLDRGEVHGAVETEIVSALFVLANYMVAVVVFQEGSETLRAVPQLRVVNGGSNFVKVDGFRLAFAIVLNGFAKSAYFRVAVEAPPLLEVFHDVYPRAAFGAEYTLFVDLFIGELVEVLEVHVLL